MSSFRGRRLRRFAALTLALLPSVVTTADASAGSHPPSKAMSTPQLIAEAQRAGKISEAVARKHLANAVLNPKRLPKRFIGRGEWEGTPVLSRLRKDLRVMPKSRPRARLSNLLESKPAQNETCEGSTARQQLRVTTDHFVIDFVTGKPGGGLTVDDYVAALEQSWQRQIVEFGWAAPPVKPGAPNEKFHVRVDSQTYGMLGYVGAAGSRAGEVGDNPATSWTERHAWATCMVLRDRFAGTREASLRSLRSTAPHELAHAVQWGYGFADWLYDGQYDQFTVFSEATATWIEDEVFDDVNRAWGWGMPDVADSLDPHRTMWSGGSYGEEYKMWLPFRAITERFGSGVPGGAEQVFEDLFELIGGREGKLSPAGALENAMRGQLPSAWNEAGLALWFMETCREGWAAPYCLEEASLSAAAKTPRTAHGQITHVNGRFTGAVESRYAMQWIRLPRSARPSRLYLRNRSAKEALRLSVGCRTRSGGDTALYSVSLPGAVDGGQQRHVTLRPTSVCLEAPTAVITSAAVADTSGDSAYELEFVELGRQIDRGGLPVPSSS